MPRPSISSAILASLAAERRVIAADWRIQIHYLRTARAGAFALPDHSKVRSLIRRMASAGELDEVSGVPFVYRVSVPYAAALPAGDEVVLQEASPTGVFGGATALAWHGLTNRIPDEIHVTVYGGTSPRLPPGTAPDDWVDVPPPPHRTPPKIGERAVIWTRTKPEWDFGAMIGYVDGVPVWFSDLERTLIDAIRFPEKCGGIAEVFSAWRSATDRIDLNRVLSYCDRIGQALLRQRVGYLLETLGRKDSRLDAWAGNSRRGGSAKLHGGAEFSPTYSARWNLSLNVPPSLIETLSEGSSP